MASAQEASAARRKPLHAETSKTPSVDLGKLDILSRFLPAARLAATIRSIADDRGERLGKCISHVRSH